MKSKYPAEVNLQKYFLSGPYFQNNNLNQYCVDFTYFAEKVPDIFFIQIKKNFWDLAAFTHGLQTHEG